MKQNEFLTIREKLTDFFLNHPGALLDAETYLDTTSADARRVPRVFELTSGIQKRRFLSLWALFQSRKMFEETTGHITRIAQRIREHTRFHTIVTCTVTSRYLMDHLHADLEVSENDKVNVRYFGPYPYHAVEDSALQDLRDQRVLILTDVISSGSLAGHLASVVRQLGGEVAAILSVAVVNPDFCLITPKFAEFRDSPYAPQYRMLNVGALTEKLPVYNIVDVPLPSAPEGHSYKEVIKIDPLSVLPVSGAISREGSGRGAILSMAEAIPLLERTKGIAVSFFQAENCRYTYAVRIPKILCDPTAASVIWRRLSDLVPTGRDVLFVTTFDKECLTFLDFVTRNSGFGNEDPAHVMQVPFAGELGAAAAYTFVQNEAKRIKGRTVVLLLGVVHTSERLRSLVALLASARPKQIISIVLLDRMDASSSMFMPRVRELSANIENGISARFSLVRAPRVRFSTHSVFCLRDFSTNEIGRMQEMVRRLLTGFRGWCRTGSFQLLTEHDEKYFVSHRISGYEFESAKLEPFADTQRLILGGKPVETHTTEAHLLSIITKVIEERNYRLFFELLDEVRDKSIIYRIASYLLIDISYLRGTGDFNELSSRIMERLRLSRYKRCEQEMKLTACCADRRASPDEVAAEVLALKEQIRDDVLVESYLIFVLALFSFLDTKNEYRALIEDLMLYTRAADIEDILDSSPINAIIYLEQARTLWSITFLAYLTDRNFREAERQSFLNKMVLEQASRLSQWLSRKLTKMGEVPHEQEIRAAISNLDNLRSELGEFNLHQYHEMIRLMHKHLILQPPQHSPIRTILYGIRDEMVDQLDLRPPSDGSITIVGLPSQREIQGRLEQGWLQLSVLQRIGEAASELFSTTELAINSLAPERFQPGEGAGLERGRKPSQFEEDVKAMASILLKVRQNNAFGTGDVYEFSERLDRIDGDLWNYTGSQLLRSLCHFIQPLDSKIREALKDAAQTVKAYNNAELLRSVENAVFEGFIPDASYFVLCEPALLSEMLRNIFTNIRHAASSGLALHPVRITLLPSGADSSQDDFVEADDRDAINVEIWTPGDASKIHIDSDNPSTLARHKAELHQDYSAELRVKPGMAGEGVIMQLSFRSRNLHVARLRREWHNRDEDAKRRFASHIFFGGRI